MSDQHWDALARRAASTLDRRGSLKALGAVALIAGLSRGEAPRLVTAKGKKGKGKGNGKGKGKGNKNKPKKPRNRCLPEPESCSGGACAAEPEWVGEQCEINHCEFICRQCDVDDNGPFCIRNGLKPDGTPTKVADCCEEGEACCNGKCCQAGKRCCGGHCCGPTPEIPGERCCNGSCVDINGDGDHCGGCSRPCVLGTTCLDGTCVTYGPPRCDGGCELGQTCCYGQHALETFCVDLNNDSQHCGACRNACPTGMSHCVEGRCHRCPRGGPFCPPGPDGSGGGCFPPGFQCCDDGNGCPTSHRCCIYSPINGGGHYCDATGDCPYS